MDLPSPSPAASAPAAPLTFRTLVNAERFLARVLVGTGLLLGLALLIFLAAFSLVELTSRQNALRDWQAESTEIQAKIANAARDGVLPAETGAELRARLAAYERAADDVQKLMSQGGGTRDDQLGSIRARLDGRTPPRGGILPAVLAGEVRLFPNEALLVVLLTVCGAIGSALAAARRKTHFTMYSVGMGVAAGFVAFLAIRGGRDVFLAGAEASNLTFNPYSSAFLALLAGLFSEKGYGLLTSLINTFSRKLEKTVQE